MFAYLGMIYGFLPSDLAQFSYGQLKAYLDRVPAMQKAKGDAVAAGLVPIVTALYAR